MGYYETRLVWTSLTTTLFCYVSSPINKGVCVYMCVFITAVPITKLCACTVRVGGGGSWRNMCYETHDEPRFLWARSVLENPIPNPDGVCVYYCGTYYKGETCAMRHTTNRGFCGLEVC